MKKIYRKVIAILLSIAMVVTTFAFYDAKVEAAVLTNDEKTSIAGNGPMANLALSATPEAYPGVAEGNINNLNNGSMTNGHCALSNPGWGYHGEGYAILELDDTYDASIIDEIVIAYKDTASNDTVVGRTYNIQISNDKTNWTTIFDQQTPVEATDLGDDKCTIDKFNGQSTPSLSGNFKYVKVDYPTVADYGIQITEIAILSDFNISNAASVTASSLLGKLSFSITAGSGQAGYKYIAYLDDASGKVLNNNCDSGTTYSFDVSAGSHSVFVVSTYKGAYSTGISSNTVTVGSYEPYVDNAQYNYAYNQTPIMMGGSSTEGSGTVTDGTISTSNYMTPTKNVANSWMGVQLGTLWKSSGFETVVVWFRNIGASAGNSIPNSGGLIVEYSTDGETWDDVKTFSQTELNALPRETDTPFAVPIDVSDVTGTVQYIRVLVPQALGWGAQISEIGVFDIDGDAEEASHETVVNPDNFTAVASSPNTITGTITGATGHNDYAYNIYLNNSQTPILAGLSAGNYTISCLDAGTYDVTCKSEHNGFYSPGIKIDDVVVASGFTYSHTFETGVFPDSNSNGNNYITQNGKTVYGVSGTASEGTGGDAPGMALDYNGGTRWGTSANDPQWLQVDLGSLKAVKEVDLWWETASSKDFVISVSTDGTSFRDVAYKNNAESGANRRDVFELVSEVNARYIKFNCKNRTTEWGHSIWELAVYGSTPLRTVTIGENSFSVFDGGKFKFPQEGETGYAPHGYYLNSNQSNVYAPGDEVTVNNNLAFTGFEVSFESTTGATIHMVKSEPGIAFRTTAYLNGSAPIFNSAFKYGMVITTNDFFVDEYEENLVIDNTRNQVHVELNNSSQMSSGTYTIGVLNVKQENFTRDFVSRGYVKINYVDGDSLVVYATNPTATNRKRNIAQVANLMKNTPSYYDRLDESEKQAVDYFASFYAGQ